MSAAARQLLADAISTVQGVDVGLPDKLDLTGYPNRPATLVSGAAWPVWARSTPLTGCGFDTQYAVLVALPGGTLADQNAAVDALLQPIRDALDDANVTASAYEPDEIQVQESGPTQPVLRITVTIAD